MVWYQQTETVKHFNEFKNNLRFEKIAMT
jgi:hypothetical protein